MTARTPILDPTRLPILTADGPTDVLTGTDSVILTFSQRNPTLSGDKRIEAVALVRISMTRERFALLIRDLVDQGHTGQMQVPQTKN